MTEYHQSYKHNYIFICENQPKFRQALIFVLYDYYSSISRPVEIPPNGCWGSRHQILQS